MSRTGKWLVVALAGALAACAVMLAGCFGGGGSGSKAYEGLWTHDSTVGIEGYDMSWVAADEVRLDVASATEATFYFFDDAPYTGTLTRVKDADAEYATDGFKTEVYWLQSTTDSQYWELVFVTPNKDKNGGFWYVHTGSGSSSYDVYLTKGEADKAGIAAMKWEKNPIRGDWSLTSAYTALMQAYELSELPGTVKLTVDAPDHATFTFLDQDPWSGELVEMTDQEVNDSGFNGRCFHIVGADGQYWELYFCTVWDEDGYRHFWEVDAYYQTEPDVFYLEQVIPSSRN